MIACLINYLPCSIINIFSNMTFLPFFMLALVRPGVKVGSVNKHENDLCMLSPAEFRDIHR